MSKFIRKSHNVTILMYHIVCPVKYRKVVFDNEVAKEVVNICEDISKRYEIVFLEIGIDKDHIHFLVQSVPDYSPKKIAQVIKSITAIEIFKRKPAVKKKLWGGEFWSKGYFVSTVGKYGNEDKIKNYVKNQGIKEYKKIYEKQLEIFVAEKIPRQLAAG